MDVSQFDEITTTVLRSFEKSGKVQDQIFNGDPLFAWLSKKGRKQVKGGREIQVNLRYAKNTTVGSYEGWDVLDTTPQNTLAHAIFTWKQYSAAIAVDGATIAKTESKEGMLDLVADKTQEATDSLQDAMTVDLYSDGTGNDSKDLLGLGALVTASGTLGGISRTDYSWWQANVTNKSSAALDTAMMRKMVHTCRGPSGGTGQMAGKVDLILTSQTLFESFEALLEPYLRVQSLDMAELGFTDALRFKGANIVWSENIADTTMYFLSTDYMGLRVMPGRDFSFSKWKEPTNQDGKLAFIYWMGQLVCSNSRRLGALTNVAA